MKTRKAYLVLATAIAIFTGCKKDNAKKDCEVNNYGTIKISFPANSPTNKYMVMANNIVYNTDGASALSIHCTPGAVTFKINNITQGTVSQNDLNIDACTDTAITAAN